VTVTGRFGMTYFGSPIEGIPTTEMRTELLNSEHGWMVKPIPVEPPNWAEFKLDREPLFETCADYLTRAQGLVSEARELAEKVHGEHKITPPPSDMG
jgi:hypothetical protein